MHEVWLLLSRRPPDFAQLKNEARKERGRKRVKRKEPVRLHKYGGQTSCICEARKEKKEREKKLED